MFFLTSTLAACGGGAPEWELGERHEIVHPGAAHRVHVSGPALAVAPDGRVHLAWSRGDAAAPEIVTLRLGAEEADAAAFVGVSPPGLAASASHDPPGLAVGPQGEVHVTWSSRRPAGAGTPFAADLWLSTSLDGGARFGPPLRVSEETPRSRGFEGVAADAAGAVLVAWIETGEEGAATLLARVEEGVVTSRARLGARTCPCCRVEVAVGSDGRVGVLWRDELPGQVRDMVMALSRDGGRSFASPRLVHDDGWALDACPHRGGSLAFDGRGRVAAAWYTEGPQQRPAVTLALAADGVTFGLPRPLHDLPGALPDRVSLALRPDGAGLVVWESATPVRREIAGRSVGDAGRRLGATRVLSRALKASAPAAAVTPSGGLVVAWNEEAFPTLRTIVQTFTLTDPAGG